MIQRIILIMLCLHGETVKLVTGWLWKESLADFLMMMI